MTHEWTVLLYLAGDNGRIFTSPTSMRRLMAGMTPAALADVVEAQQVGSTDRVAVLVQLDTLGTPAGQPKGSYRLELRAGSTAWNDLAGVIPEANTGDPAELASFIVWGMARRPARHTLLVLWNHGTGWKDTDAYAAVRSQSRSANAVEEPREENVAFFSTTAAWLRRLGQEAGDAETRGILYDDSSMDFLTNAELSQALRAAEVAATPEEARALCAEPARLEAALAAPASARRRLSAIGMDACLMAMVEVQYQVRQFADVMIASQEVEPMQGWPYNLILQRLNERPAMTPAELGAVVVEEYARSLSTRAVTQSAVNLAGLEATRAKIDALATAVREVYPYDMALRTAFRDAANAVRGVFRDKDYADLAEYAAQLHERYYDGAGVDQAVLNTSAALRDWLRSGDGPVLACAATGKYGEANASGITIYLPRCYAQPGRLDLPKQPPSPAYRELDFASAGWYGMLQSIYEAS